MDIAAPDTQATVTPADIDAISAMSDPIDRNRRISATYHVLAVALAQKSGRPDLSWCAFATWASVSAGRIIAMREIPTTFRTALDASADYQAARTRAGRYLEHADVLRAADAVAVQVSAAIAAGNLLVFTELAPLFTGLLAGATPPADTAADLVAAFAGYAQALVDPDPVRAAQGMLAANTAAVAHEQQRLQPYIAEALNAGLRDAAQRVLRDRLVGHDLRLLEPWTEPMLQAAERAWDDAITRHATTLTTPERTFDLGVDVPVLADGSRGPAALEQLAAPDPFDLVSRYDRTDGTLVGSAAHDWAQLADRMNYIVNLFRSRQQLAVLLQPPE